MRRRRAREENPLSQTAWMWIIGGGFAASAAGIAWYYTMGPGAPPGSTSGTAGQAISNGTTPSGAVVSTTPNKQALTATNASSGQTFTMHVGDTLTVTLSLPNGAVNYSAAQVVGSSLTPGQANVSGAPANSGWSSGSSTMTQVWTATSTGNETFSYQPIDGSGNSVGPMLSFSAVVT